MNNSQSFHEEDKKYVEYLYTLVLLEKEKSSTNPNLQKIEYLTIKSKTLKIKLENLMLELKSIPKEEADTLLDEGENKIFEFLNEKADSLVDVAQNSSKKTISAHPKFKEKHLSEAIKKVSDEISQQVQSIGSDFITEISKNAARANKLEWMLQAETIESQKKELKEFLKSKNWEQEISDK